MAAHRIGARLSGLSPEQLLLVIKEQSPSRSQLCAIIEAQAGASAAALRVAEEHAARLVEQPEWILSKVLLSPDLAPHILAQLPIKAHAVKGTCRAWRRGWKETLKKQPQSKCGRLRWTSEEVEQLKRGYQKYGEGRWADILREFKFHKHRTNVHLKDKWRNLNK